MSLILVVVVYVWLLTFCSRFSYPGITFINRPVVGGFFALLALDSAPTDGYVTPSS